MPAYHCALKLCTRISSNIPESYNINVISITNCRKVNLPYMLPSAIDGKDTGFDQEYHLRPLLLCMDIICSPISLKMAQALSQYVVYACSCIYSGGALGQWRSSQ